MHERRRFFGLLAAFFVLSVIAGRGQTNRGSVSGSVFDASGAAIPNATVQLVHVDTGETATLTTGNTGEFVFPDLIPGTYTLTVSHAGFQTQKINNVDVQVERVTSFPVTLRVAQAAQTVEVSAAAATLETQQTALNSVVSGTAVNDIPLNGRDYRQLLAGC